MIADAFVPTKREPTMNRAIVNVVVVVLVMAMFFLLWGWDGESLGAHLGVTFAR